MYFVLPRNIKVYDDIQNMDDLEIRHYRCLFTNSSKILASINKTLRS